MPKVSVIIPIYGVEKFISRCARSLFNQTLDDIEYIFINDCTKDNSIEILRTILEEYPQRKLQSRIIDMPSNSGLPTARKFGIHLATGDYIIHCDSDDWTSPTMYEQMWKKAVADDADIVNVRAYLSTDTENIKFEEHYIDDKIALMFSYVGMWSKLVRRELYEKIWRYPTRNMWEDRVFTVQLVWNARKISFINEYLYHYYINPNSMCRDVRENAIKRNWNDVKENLDIIKEYILRHDIPNCEKYLLIREFCALDIIAPFTNKSEWYDEWRKTYPDFHKKNILLSSLPIKYKLKYYLTYYRIFPYIQKWTTKKLKTCI